MASIGSIYTTRDAARSTFWRMKHLFVTATVALASATVASAEGPSAVRGHCVVLRGNTPLATVPIQYVNPATHYGTFSITSVDVSPEARLIFDGATYGEKSSLAIRSYAGAAGAATVELPTRALLSGLPFSVSLELANPSVGPERVICTLVARP